MKLSKNLKNMREDFGLTQVELAEHLGISQTSIMHYEKGTKMPSVAVLWQIADKFDCSIDKLLGRKIN